MGNKLRKLVCGLGKNIPPTTTANDILDLAQGARWSDETLAKLHREIQLEKVVMQAYDNACLLNQQQETRVLRYLIDALREEYEKRRSFTEVVIPSVRAEATRILEQAGVNFLFIKGSSLEGYPHRYCRQMNDLDLIVERWDDLFLAAQALEAHGYSHITEGIRLPEFILVEAIDTPWIMRLLPSGSLEAQMVGQVNLARHEGDHIVALDVHTTPFVVGSTGLLECDMWERARAQRSTLPMPEDKLLILVAHAANHGYFLIKDCNDVYAILERHKDVFDWDYFCRCVQQSTLSYAAYYILKRVRQEYAKECVPGQALNTLRRSREMICAAAIAVTSQSSKKWQPWAERVMYTLHALAFEGANYGLASGLKKAVEYLWRSFQFSVLQGEGLVGAIGEHPIVQQLLHPERNLIFPFPRRGQQILIVPAAAICDDLGQEQLATCLQTTPAAFQEAIAGERDGPLEVKPVGRSTAFLRLGSAEAVLTPIDLFIPTQDAVFTESEVVAQEELVGVLLDMCT